MMSSETDLFVHPVRDASRRLVRELGFMKPTLAGTDLPPSSVHALIEIDAQGTLSAGALCLLLNLEKSSVSRMVRKLVNSGELAESIDDRDGRARTLKVTAQGRRTLDAIDAFARSQVAAALARLHPEERRLLRDSLTAYAGALHACRTGAPGGDISPASIALGYRSGIIGRCIEMHAGYYHRHGFGAYFETSVAAGLADFVPRLSRPVNGLWSAIETDRIVGTIAIDGEHLGTGIAHLRWFIVEETQRGSGIGRRLLAEALSFCDMAGFDETQLWTFRGLDAARRIYETNGFVLAEERPGRQWGAEVTEQRFVRTAAGRQHVER